MKLLKVDEITSYLNAEVDKLLVSLVDNPKGREEIDIPYPKDIDLCGTFRTFYSKETPVCALRETVLYSGIVDALEKGYVLLDMKSLSACLSAMYKCPYIDYCDLKSYHKYASEYYVKQGNEKKALIHRSSYLMMQSFVDIIEEEESISFVEVLDALQYHPKRYLALLLYISRYACSHLKKDTCRFGRVQYTLIEQTMKKACHIHVQDESIDTEFRSCIAYFCSLYYRLTNRYVLAEKYKNSYLEINGEQDYEKLCDSLFEILPAPYKSAKDWADFVLSYTQKHNEDGDADDDLDADLADELDVYQDLHTYGFFRQSLMENEFNRMYIKAERGDMEVVPELVRCYRDGIGVTACTLAAEAWLKKKL